MQAADGKTALCQVTMFVLVGGRNLIDVSVQKHLIYTSQNNQIICTGKKSFIQGK